MGALDVDPDVIGGYTCATAEAAGVKFELTTLAKMGRFDQEVNIDMPAASDIPRLETIQVKPVCMGFEDFYAGWRRRRRRASRCRRSRGAWSGGAASRPCSTSRSSPTVKPGKR